MAKLEPEYIDNVIAKRETDKALLCLIEDEEHWIPKSQIEPESDVQSEGDEGTLCISGWLAREIGF